MKLEERSPDDQKLKGISKLIYYMNWLESLGDDLAHKLSQLIKLYVKNIYKSSYYSNIIVDKEYLTDVNEYDIYYLNQLSEKTKYHIKTRPCWHRLHKIDCESNQGTLIEVKINKKVLEVIGCMELTMANFKYNKDYSVIDCTTCIRTRDWIEFYVDILYDISKLAMDQYFGDKAIVMPTSTQLRDVNGNKINGKFVLFREAYMKNCKIYYISYAVFFEE